MLNSGLKADKMEENSSSELCWSAGKGFWDLWQIHDREMGELSMSWLRCVGRSKKFPDTLQGTEQSKERELCPCSFPFLEEKQLCCGIGAENLGRMKSGAFPLAQHGEWP